VSTFGFIGVESGSGPTSEADRVSPPLPSGTTVGGKYVIERVIGSGGNGTVYEAKHATIGHRVAIKVVHATLSGQAEVLARFGREARICAALRHPNIGQVYDVGLLEGATPYMVMELQDGLSLADIIEETTLSMEAIIALGQQLLAALKCAHDGGVIHRDVKPDNVMVVRDAGGQLILKLVDFGIAKRVAPLVDGKVTQRGVLVGSPEYMAPEQLRSEDVDARTDIYAVGVLLYEAITGLTPFHGHTTADLFAAILHAPVEPPIRYRSDCPPELQLVVLAALSRDPAQRPPSAEEMARALALVPLRGRDVGTTLSDLRARLGPSGSDNALSAHPAVLRGPADVRVRGWRVRRMFKPVRARVTTSAALALVLLPVLIASRGVLGGEPTAPARTPAQAPLRVSPDRLEQRLAVPANEQRVPSEARAARDDEAGRPPPGSRSHSAAKVRVAHGTKQDVRSSEDLLKEATTAFVRGDAARARELYLAVLARDPQRPEALRGLGLALTRLSRDGEAVRAFERYLDGRDDAPDAARIRELLARARVRAQSDS
jgi:serine/threonine-protein kinase